MRQLVEDTLVAVVEMLRELLLLYRVKAEVDVPALEVVLMELRQLLDTIELALDATGRPLRVLFGEIARSDRLSGYPQWSAFASGLRDDLCARDLLLAFVGGIGALARRPRFHVDPLSLAAAGVWGEGALRPIMRFVTLLAVVDMGGDPPRSKDVGGETSSTGETRPVAGVLFLPKLSFHLDGFLVTGGGTVFGEDGGEGSVLRVPLRGAVSKGCGRGKRETGSNGSAARRDEVAEFLVDTDLLVDEDLDALLISRANDCDASASVASVSSLGVVGGTRPLPFLAPLFLRLLVEVDREAVPSRSKSWFS